MEKALTLDRKWSGSAAKNKKTNYVFLATISTISANSQNIFKYHRATSPFRPIVREDKKKSCCSMKVLLLNKFSVRAE